MKTILLGIALFFLTGCVNYGASVMVSKGRAGAVQAVFGADAEFCKLTATDGVEITEADREAFRGYCSGE
jgi:hypothetical protein